MWSQPLSSFPPVPSTCLCSFDWSDAPVSLPLCVIVPSTVVRTRVSAMTWVGTPSCMRRVGAASQWCRHCYTTDDAASTRYTHHHTSLG